MSEVHQALGEPHLVELQGIAKHYKTPAGTVRVLDGLDLSIREGEFVGLTGPSGSGKTTLLNIVALMDPPTGGTLRFAGQAIPRGREGLRRRLRRDAIGMVFQKFCLLPNRTALDNVLFRCRYMSRGHRRGAKRRAEELLIRFGLHKNLDQKARLLSGGEMQRVAMARAMVHRPALLVADEPTGNLDAGSAELVMQYLEDLNREGITVLLVTHNESLLKYCSRHIRCEGGRVVDVWNRGTTG